MHLPESCTHEYTTDLCVCSSDTGRVHHTHVLTTVELVSAGCLPLGSGRGEATLIRGVRRGHGDSVGTLGQRVQTALKHLNMCVSHYWSVTNASLRRHRFSHVFLHVH